jgi:hypothetical protein
MRSSGRVTALAAAFLLSLATASPGADESSAGLDRDVVVVGEDRIVLLAPEPAGWGYVELPDLDPTPPKVAPEPPLAPPIPPWTAPPPVQVIAHMEGNDA